MTQWKYWQSKTFGSTIIADNGEASCTWFPECGRWNYLEPSSNFVHNGHWQEMNRLEYLIRWGSVLPEPPEYIWSEQKQPTEIKDNE